MKPRIFLSYSSKDEKIVGDLITFIQTLEVELIRDKESLVASDPIGDRLRQHIQSSHGCVWVLTKNSIQSNWCPVEVGAFWGAGKPIIIYNPLKLDLKGGPFIGLNQARDLKDIKKSVEGLELRATTLATLTVQEANELIEASVESSIKGLSEDLRKFGEHLPAIHKMAKFLEVQNTYLPDHVALLSKITGMVERKPKKLVCAFDVPSFGSVSAPEAYQMCCDAFDKYVMESEWDLTILLLPADVGTKIVKTEFRELERQRMAWEGDIEALNRFQGYMQRAAQKPNRKFKIGWLEVNRDSSGTPLGVHSMPLNVWVSSDEEAVFSTVINNYHPSNADAAAAPNLPNVSNLSSPKESGFSTRNEEMILFFNEILSKYEKNIDEEITLVEQIDASEREKLKIEALISGQNKK